MYAIYAWGAGSHGQLGSSRMDDKPLPELLWRGLESMPFIACGGSHAAVIVDGVYQQHEYLLQSSHLIFSR